MFLKRIEITGFKSFASKTVLDFSASGVFEGGKNIGITAIVGPNGSGKSNIADALRWVLGEQSMKSIRGKKSEDIIFAGSRKKARLGSAQVSIFLDNSQKRIPIEYETVVITRKIFRSGEGEYYINQSQVRLLDVVDLLAKAGIGQRSYCIINQGMADQVLNASDLERRSIIEEAAGVKEFQVKKERSQRKLKSTFRNLERVKQLLNEIEPHLKMLRRQCKKAEKGEEYRRKLKEKQALLFGFLWHKAEDDFQSVKQQKEEIGRRVMQIQREVDELEEKLKKESGNFGNTRDEIAKLEKEERNFNFNLNQTERSLVIEEGKLELEKERLKMIPRVETISVDAGFIKKRLFEIRKNQEELIRRIAKTEKLSDLQDLKEYAQVIAQEMYELLEGISKGKIEKKKPEKEVEQLRTVNLKKIQAQMEKVSALKKKREELERKLKKIRTEVAKLVEKDRQDRKAALEIEDQLRRKRFELDKVREVYGNLKVEQSRFEFQKEELEKRIANEFRSTPKELKKPTEKVEVDQLENEINRLKFQLEQVGAVDESIIEEFNETEKRYNFLKKESEDLTEAAKKLKKVIREMDEKVKSSFEKTFQEINRNFNHYFKIIFGGGKAGLRKKEVKTASRSLSSDKDEIASLETAEEAEANPEETTEEKQLGVEIFAEPPGKKITNLGMLSGGERALCSIALLFAIISHNPPPFALLDEVEAALDEANSRRFGRILKELSGKTQFILITHNRQTMREASVLYGVTMNDDGISKLLSVKLEQVGEKGEIKEN